MNMYPLQLFQNELCVSPFHQTPNQGIIGVYLFIVVYLFLLAEVCMTKMAKITGLTQSLIPTRCDLLKKQEPYFIQKWSF